MESSRIGKTRDFFKKIGDTKEIFYPKIGKIMDKNGKDLSQAKEIKKRWQEYTELNVPDNHDGAVTHLEQDILEYNVKEALGNITTNKASGGDGIPAELFQILKDDTVKVLHSIYLQIGNSAVATGVEKVSFHFNPKEGHFQRMFKLLYNCTHFTC